MPCCSSSKRRNIGVGRRISGIENIRCTLVGDDKVGKTSALMSYHADTCPAEYVPTVFDSYSRRIPYNDRVVNLLLYDTGGNEEAKKFGTHGWIGTDVFLLCFSIDDPSSFNNILQWTDKIHKEWHNDTQACYKNLVTSSLLSDSVDSLLEKRLTKSECNFLEPIIILVGCKSDTRTSNSLFEELKLKRYRDSIGKDKNIRSRTSIKPTLSTYQHGMNLSRDIRAYKYMECCARNGTGIKEIFNDAMKAVLDRREHNYNYR